MDNSGNVVKEKEFATRTIKGMLWIIIGRSGNIVLQIIVMILLSRMLNAEEYGTALACMVSIGFCEIFLQYTIPPILIQKMNLNHKYINNSRSFSLILGVILCALNNIYALYADQIWGIEGLGLYINVLSIVFIIQSITIVDEALYQRDLQFKFLSLRRIISYGLGYGLFGIICALLGMGTWSLIVAYLMQAVVNAITLILNRKIRARFNVHKEEYIEIAKLAFGNSLNRLGTFFALQGDNFIIGMYLGSATLGIYGRAYQFFSLPTSFIGEMFEKGLFSALSAYQNDTNKLKFYFNRSLSLVLLVVVPVSIMFFIFSEEFVLLLLGEEWIQVAIPFQILCLGIPFRVIYKLCESIIRSVGIIYRKALIEIFYAVSVIVGALLGVRWGLNYVCLFVLLAVIINCVICLISCNKVININLKEIVLLNYKSIIALVLLTISTMIITILVGFMDASKYPIIKLLICGPLVLASYYLVYYKIFKFGDLIRLKKMVVSIRGGRV